VTARGTKILAGVAVVAVGAAGAVYVLRDGSRPEPDGAAEDYLAAWEQPDFAAMERLVADPPESFIDTHQAVIDDLGVTEASYEVTGVSTDGGDAIATFDAQLSLAGLGEWSYEGRLRMHYTSRQGEDGRAWLVDWSPLTIHPHLGEGERLARTVERPERAPIVDAAGDPLVTTAPGTVVGIQPSRVTDRQQVKDALAANLGVDPALIDQRLDAPGVQPDHFVVITTISSERYEQVRPAIYPIPGTVFRDTMVRVAPSPGFAQHLLGRTGEITAERLEELGDTYQAGDVVGLTGLESRFETQLAGTASGEVRIELTEEAAEAAGNDENESESEDDSEGSGEEDDGPQAELLTRIEGTAPEPVATTLDRRVQDAVETGLAGVSKPVAAVVIDGSGNIRGAASRPLDDDFNRALAGTYPPGSTFKVVSTSALLAAGMTPDTPIDCPPTLNAGGREFRNFEGGQLGTVPFGLAFAESCNTAFINATADMPATDLVAAAERFGFNTEYSVGLTTESATFPPPSDATEQAAATIGQGRTLASPLHMATVAAAVMDGTWEPPTLLPDHPSENTPAPVQLDAAIRDTLAGLMRRVVTEGSGTAAAVPGVEVSGKTGTAEYGEGDPPPTHAWFIGFRGSYALALLIEDGGVGGRDAAPVAQRIFAALPAG
jgi:cell division protein FtsI/penicillin-binding protein 2